MPDGYPIQTNFTSGEVSPLIRGRVDINRYFNGVAKLRNFIVRPQGGIVHRSGTRFDAVTKNLTELSIVVKFEFSETIAFTLLFGKQYIRFLDSTGAVIQLAGNPYEVATPYLEAELRDLYFTQSADVMYICHPSYPPKTLSRITDTNWVLADFVHDDGPYLDDDTSNKTLWMTGFSNLATITSTVAEFVVGDVGKYVEFPYKGKMVIGVIVTYLNTSQVTITPFDDLVVDVTGFDNRAILAFAASGSTPANITSIVGGTHTTNISLAGGGAASYAAPVLSMTGTGSKFNIPNGWQYNPPSGGSAWPDRIRSTLAIWTEAHCNRYIRVEGAWYLTGKHILATETVNVTPGGNVSMDCIEVTDTPVMKATTGTLTFANHFIGAHLLSSSSLFTSNDTNRQFRLNFSGEQVWGYILSVTSGVVDGVSYGSDQHCLVVLGRMMPPATNKQSIYLNDAKTLSWRFGAWYTGNYPRCSVFHEERLWFGGTPLQPQTVWSSKSGDFTNFAPTDPQTIVTDDSAITSTIASNAINPIKWMQSHSVLLIGTTGAEWQTKATAINQPITPSNIDILEQTSFGSALYGRSIKIGHSVLFPQKAGNKIREMTYNFQIDGYEAKDLTIVSEHILRERGGWINSAYQKESTSVYWAATVSGDLVGMTYEKDQEVTAFHVHTLGGVFGSGTPVVLSVCTIPLSDGTNQIFMTVKRTINGATKVYVEHIDVDFNPTGPSDLSSMFYLDCALTYSGAPVSSVSGLGHLEGQTVMIMADGTLRNNQVVSSGSVNISGPSASKVHVGLYSNAIMTVLPIESGSASGTAQGKIKRVQRVNIKVLNSLTFKMGPTESDIRAITFKSPGGNALTTLFTGEKGQDLDQDYGTDGVYSIVQDKPYALTVLALMPQMQTNI